MRWTFDATADALYVYLSDGVVAAQVVMPDGTVIDVDSAGSPVGVEVLRPWALWDVEAIVDRFGLDIETARSLRWVGTSPLTVAGSARQRDTRVPVQTTDPLPTTSTQSAFGLVPA